MAGGKGNYLSGKLLDLIFGNTAYVVPTTIYIALYTAMPSGTGGGTEVTGGGYARVAVPNDVAHWPNQSGGVKVNGQDIDFGSASADWGTIVGAAAWDALTSGNELYWGPFISPVAVLNGNSFKVASGGATFTEA